MCLIPHSREEKRVPLGIGSLAFTVILGRVERLPDAGREDVFVALVPATIDHLGEVGVVARALEVFLRGGGGG